MSLDRTIFVLCILAVIVGGYVFWQAQSSEPPSPAKTASDSPAAPAPTPAAPPASQPARPPTPPTPPATDTGHLLTATPAEVAAPDGSLSPGAIAMVVRRKSTDVRACYDRALKRKPKLQGKLEVLVTIAKDGRVRQARIEQSTLKDAGVESCVQRVFATLRFPASSGPSTVRYPIVLHAE